MRKELRSFEVIKAVHDKMARDKLALEAEVMAGEKALLNP